MSVGVTARSQDRPSIPLAGDCRPIGVGGGVEWRGQQCLSATDVLGGTAPNSAIMAGGGRAVQRA